MKVLLVDDHVLFREGLASLLSGQPDFQVLGEAGTISEAVAKVAELKPELVLLDISLPDGNGLEAIEKILAFRPETIIVLLTVHDADDLLFYAVNQGAQGYLLKSYPASRILASLRALERGEAAISRSMTRRILDEFHRVQALVFHNDSGLKVLSSRELEVLRLLGSGKSNREIADQLYISENTVKIHVHNILEKLKLRNRQEAAVFAQRHGLATAPEKIPPPIS